jgi:hypothetical protein
MGKPKNWIVFEADDEILCIQDFHRGDERDIVEAGGVILGYPSMEKPKDAIDYIKDLHGRM